MTNLKHCWVLGIAGLVVLQIGESIKRKILEYALLHDTVTCSPNVLYSHTKMYVHTITHNTSELWSHRDMLIAAYQIYQIVITLHKVTPKLIITQLHLTRPTMLPPTWNSAFAPSTMTNVAAPPRSRPPPTLPSGLQEVYAACGNALTSAAVSTFCRLCGWQQWLWQ